MKICIFAFTILALTFSAPIWADDFDWTGGGGNNNWSNAANWTNTTPAGTETIPDADDNVSFAIDTTTGIGTAANLTNSALFTMAANQNITLSGSSIANTGTLTFGSDNSNNFGGVPDTRFTIDSAMSLTGGGNVVLMGTQTGFAGSGTLTNVDNVIRGFGQLQVNVINQNTIQAEAGVLSLVDGISLNNSGGQVALAADGELDLGTSLLEGGTLAATAGSLVHGGTLKDVTVTGTLTEGMNNNTNWEGTITNQGTLTFTADNSNNFGGVPDTRFTVDTPVTLNGGGIVELTGNETGLTGAGVLTNVDNTIRGFGQMQVDIINQGTIQAEGGVLALLNGISLNNSGGQVSLAIDGELDLGTSLLEGGTLAATAGSLVHGGTLKDVTVTGTLTEGMNNNTNWEGTITNQGTITMTADNSNNFGGVPDTRFTINTPVTLDGGGIVELTGNETGLTGSGILTNVDNTIRGFGQLQVDIINQGVIQAEAGVLSLEDGISLNNSAGQVALAVNGELDLGTGLLEGGALAATTGSLVRGGTLKDVTVTGTLTERINNNTNWEGTITNQGTITMTVDSTNNFGGVPDTRFTINTPVTLDGGGIVELTGNETGLTGSGILTNADNTIRGFGQLQVKTVNDSIIRAEGGKLLVSRDSTGDGEWQVAAGAELEINTPMLSAQTITVDATGTFDFNGSRLEVVDFVGNLQLDNGTYAPGRQLDASTLTGDLQMSSGAALEIQFSGDAAGEFDQLQISGTATVDGELQVRAIEQIGVMSTSVTFTALTAGSLEGTFDTLPAAGDHVGFGVFLDSLDFNTANDLIEISASQILFPGDFDEDGDVDSVDLDAWKTGYGTTGATLADGDADADGDVDGRDFLIWQQFRGSAPPLQANTSVPEPSTAFLLLLALATTRFRRTRVRI